MAVQNTGYKGFNKLRQINEDTGEPTGVTKDNDPNDPDYVAPVYDPAYCPYIDNEDPEFITQPSGTTGKTYISLSWESTDNVGVVEQTIFYKENSDNVYQTIVISGNTKSYIIQNLNPDTTHQAFIRAIDEAGNGTDSNLITLKTKPNITYIVLSKTYNSNNPCSGTTYGLYINSNTFMTATKLYSNSSATNLMTAGYYSDGQSWRYWSNVNEEFNPIAGLCGFN